MQPRICLAGGPCMADIDSDDLRGCTIPLRGDTEIRDGDDDGSDFWLHDALQLNVLLFYLEFETFSSISDCDSRR
jgi:hypothetical protein